MAVDRRVEPCVACSRDNRCLDRHGIAARQGAPSRRFLRRHHSLVQELDRRRCRQRAASARWTRASPLPGLTRRAHPGRRLGGARAGNFPAIRSAAAVAVSNTAPDVARDLGRAAAANPVAIARSGLEQGTHPYGALARARARAPRRLAGHARCGTALRRLLVQPHRVVRVPASPPGERAGLRRRGVERWCGWCGLRRTSGGNRARTAAQTARLGACAVDLTGVNARKESQGHARSSSQPSSDHSFGRRRDAAGGGAADDSSHERCCRPDVHHDVRVDCRSDQWRAGWCDPRSYQYPDQGQVRSPQRPFGPLRVRGPAGGRLRTRGHAAWVRGVQRKADSCRAEPAAGFQARRRHAQGDDQLFSASPSRPGQPERDHARGIAASRRATAPKCATPPDQDGTPIGGNIRPPLKIFDVKSATIRRAH